MSFLSHKRIIILSVLALLLVGLVFRVDVNAFGIITVNRGDQCTSVIVTGTASAGGWAILSKNRDASDATNKPTYFARSGTDYSYVAENGAWMGMNERGLALTNNVVSNLGFGGAGLDNGALNKKILATYETVDQVCQALNDTNSPIGPGKRSGGTCIGLIDRFGEGAFIEISGSGAYARFIVNSFDSEANHARYYPGYASGPSGRDQYALDILNEIKSEKRTISYQDVAQRVCRYVNNKEQGTSLFSVSGEMANDGTVSSMVAVSGDQRYSGKLNCFWATYGNNPINGLYIPSIPWAGSLPAITQTIYQTVAAKKTYCGGDSGMYDPVKVREVEAYAFVAEDYTFQKYETLKSTVSGSLSDSALQTTLSNYVNDAVTTAAAAYTAGVAPNSYVLTVRTVGPGTMTVTPDQSTYAYGTNVQLKAFPNTGAYFVGWSGDLTGTINTTISMTTNKTITATFALVTPPPPPPPYPPPPPIVQLTVQVVGSGLTNATGAAAYPFGSSVTVVAYSREGWTLGSWDVDGVKTPIGNYSTVTMNRNHNLTVIFIEAAPGWSLPWYIVVPIGLLASLALIMFWKRRRG